MNVIRAVATPAGEPFYRACGFREVERFTVTMPDGVAVEAVAMARPVTLSPSTS